MLKQRILRRLLPRLLTRKSPSSIPRSGEEGKKVNCYTIRIIEDNGEWLHLVEKFDKEKNELHVLSPDNKNSFVIPKSHTLNHFAPEKFHFTHYYGLYQLDYNSVYDLAFNFISKYDVVKVHIKIFWDIISQSRFNKKILVTKNTRELLHFLVEKQLNDDIKNSENWFSSSRKAIDEFSLMTELYSLRWVSHPESSQQRKKVELYLDSLVQSGNLQKNNHDYFVTGKALQTLEEYEENERRHQDAVKIQKGILWLTFVIAVAALVQAGIIKASCIADWLNSLYSFALSIF
jgi:hypothetical protein